MHNHYVTKIETRIFYYFASYMAKLRRVKQMSNSHTKSIVTECFSRWKTYSALEKYFHLQLLRRSSDMVSKLFFSWRNFVRDLKWDEWAADSTENMQLRSFLRKHFLCWKRGTAFLQWTGEWQRVPMHLATRHRKRRCPAS